MLTHALRFNLSLKQSVNLIVVLSVSYSSILLLIWTGDWSLFYKCFFTPGYSLLAIWHVRYVQYLQAHKKCILTFNEHQSPAWCLFLYAEADNHKAGAEESMALSLQPNSRLLGPFVFLCFKNSEEKKINFVLMSDSLPAGQWRLLRRWVLLKPHALLGEEGPMSIH